MTPECLQQQRILGSQQRLHARALAVLAQRSRQLESLHPSQRHFMDNEDYPRVTTPKRGFGQTDPGTSARAGAVRCLPSAPMPIPTRRLALLSRDAMPSLRDGLQTYKRNMRKWLQLRLLKKWHEFETKARWHQVRQPESPQVRPSRDDPGNENLQSSLLSVPKFGVIVPSCMSSRCH